jgi:Flp pilus assembly protein TadD
MTDVMELVQRGRVYREAGDPSTAARHLSEAVRHVPDDRSVLTELALAHYQSAALGQAEQVCVKLVELDPSDGYARLLLGRTLARQGRHAEALPQLRLAHALTGDDHVAFEVTRTENRLA